MSPVSGVGRHGTSRLVAPLARGARWSFDRMLSNAYGVVHDRIVDRFEPYQALGDEVVRLVRAGIPRGLEPRDVRVLDVACGPGNFTLLLGEAGFTVLGIDSYAVLIEMAQQKRRGARLPNVAFRRADLARAEVTWESMHDQVVNVHSLYAHPAPDALLAQAFRVLKPGGHAIFVNFTRRVPLVATFVDVLRRHGLAAAVRSLLWVLPNALFDLTRRQMGPHYWDEAEFAGRLEAAGFTLLDMRRTFFDDVSLLAWARKATEMEAG